MLPRTPAGVANDGIAPPNTTLIPVLLGCGLNWASFVASHPFEVKGLTSALVAGGGGDRKGTGEQNALVLAQLPVASVVTSRAVLERTFTKSMVHPLASPDVMRRVEHIATVWCLHPSSVYTATLSWSTEGSESVSTTTVELKVQTEDWCAPLDLRAVVLHVLDHGSLLFHPEFTRCILAQGAERFMFYLPPNPLEATTALPFMLEMWYNGLFSLPESLRLGPQHTAMFFLLANGNTRYTLDLAPESPTAPVTSSTHQHDTGTSEPATHREATVPLYPWRCQSKVRRVIRSGAYAVVVHDNPAGVMECLQRAYSYHGHNKRSTWLNDVFISLMGQCSTRSMASSTDAAASQAAESDKPHSVRLLCIELVEKATGEVMAGCCGIAVGRAYHDYTMYTLRRSKESLGTFLTKLIGEALQQCGYTLWYWGFCVEYMQQYERHFGAVEMPRDVFYRRWVAARDAVPELTIATYLQSHRGMVPYYEKTSTLAHSQS
ncbi:conserved hypothetical protein [Leishmania braziliensis MHOM/BR/75/M2904]|uniref:Uncharacterized protein n=2 Tax=Leishmania braziliensis TaxID=5660 RepID=A4HIJ0_LEIBR|nr:conserved hypothetical protein [Leishmania braziliensis MHOM/BR/75/M2904]CAJ2477331.1 unnamed protein product [Leishmania braziliensis]CAM40403.1 conserved hypothetical protein [Leishmania braziliensis MHOM/BR/75/M2904]SYZ68080.1 Leucyl/phenylalanyl-tRNA_protein_transferase [Leishmania braziliensis MHOM/BR/75/M2904]